MSGLSPRTFADDMAFARQQHESGTLAWAGMCLKFTRSGWGIGPLFKSAIASWYGADEEDRHPAADPDKAPLGSALVYKGDRFGHIMPTARDFPSGRKAAWSNDLVVHGRIDKVHRDAPVRAWGHTYVGYLTAVNDVDLRLPQTRRYAAISKAIGRLEHALETARRQGDTADAAVLIGEIARLKKLYDTLRHH